jgi:hypothetical protein
VPTFYMSSFEEHFRSLGLPEPFLTPYRGIYEAIHSARGLLFLISGVPPRGLEKIRQTSADRQKAYHDLHTVVPKALATVHRALIEAHVSLKRASPLVLAGEVGDCAHEVGIKLAQRLVSFVALVLIPRAQTLRLQGLSREALRVALLAEAPSFPDLDVDVLLTLMREEAVKAAETVAATKSASTPSDDDFTVTEAAKVFGLCAGTISKLAGKIKSNGKTGPTRRVSGASLVRYILDHQDDRTETDAEVEGKFKQGK